MDKVIIDGVNVSGCIYYNSEKFANCGMFTSGDFKCEGQICLFKQLKRLQAENFKLKESLKVYKRPDIKKVLTYYRTGELERLEQENERLKEEINKLHRKLYCYAMDKECKDGTVECKQKNCAIKLYPKYKSALDEIENVLSWIDNSNLWYNGQKAYMGDELIEFLKSRIINIINSTKAEEE